MTRVRSLDGLRGLAAMIVALGHATIATVPVLAAIAVGKHAHLSPLQHALAYTPLHGFWAGQDWVIVFFVLSGFVLSLAAAEGGRFDAASYYPRRFVRLYLPVWGAVLFAAVAHEAVKHTGAGTVWLAGHEGPLTVSRFAHDVTLIFGAGDGSFTTVLWSLQWEVLFSLLLPVYLLIAQQRRLIPVAIVSLALVLLGGRWARYMPPFMLGVVLAYGRPWVMRHLTRQHVLLLLPVSFCLLSGNWWATERVGSVLVTAGATGIVACGMVPGAFSALLSSKPFQLVGKRSFSLYLVHEPIIVAMAFALGKPGLPLLLLAAIPVIALATEAFYRLVELPAHRLARSIRTIRVTPEVAR